jgi:hypothetical protein
MSNIMDLVKNKKQALQAQSGRREKTFKCQPGKSRVRILPGWRGEGDEMFFADFGQHFIKDMKGDLKSVYVCTDKAYGKACPICDAIEHGIKESTDDDVIEALKEGKSKGRVLFNVLHLDGDDPLTPVILDLTPTTAEKVFDLMEEYGNITDLDEGVDLVINRTGKGLNTEYSVLPSPKSKAVDKAVLKNLHNLDDYVKQEYDEGRNKALSAVGSVSGFLPAFAPSSADSPTAALTDDSEPFKPTAPAKAKKDPLEGVAVEDLFPAPIDEAEAEGEAEDDAMSSDELDAMLADLG